MPMYMSIYLSICLYLEIKVEKLSQQSPSTLRLITDFLQIIYILTLDIDLLYLPDNYLNILKYHV